MAESTVELPVTQKLLDRIVQSKQQLVVLETLNVGETVTQMRTLAMRGNISVYVWDPESGITSLRESGFNVPGSKRMGDALRYVLQSTHFGIYVFIEFMAHLRAVDTVVLRRIARMETAVERKLVFAGMGFEPPEELEGLFDQLRVGSEGQARLLLRDGRWVQ